MLTFVLKAALVLLLLAGSTEAGRGKGKGGRGKDKDKDVLSLEIIEACEDELSQCSFNFGLDDLMDALEKHEDAVEEAEEGGKRPPKLAKKVRKMLKKASKCLRKVSKDLDQEGECAAALYDEGDEHACSRLEIMEFCMDEIQFDCSADFDFELTGLMDTLSTFEATMMQALDEGTKPPKLPRKVRKAIEQVRGCLEDIEDELDEDSKCLAALEGEACSEDEEDEDEEENEEEKPEDEDEDEEENEDEEEKPEDEDEEENEDEEEKPEDEDEEENEDEEEKPEDEDEEEKPEEDEEEKPEDDEVPEPDPKSAFKTRAGRMFG